LDGSTAHQPGLVSFSTRSGIMAKNSITAGEGKRIFISVENKTGIALEAGHLTGMLQKFLSALSLPKSFRYM